MRYTHRNASGATVHDVEGRKRIDHVISVDTERGEVECAHYPIRLKPDAAKVADWQPPAPYPDDDEIDTYVVKFRSIAPIYAGSHTPLLFHCYGPQG